MKEVVGEVHSTQQSFVHADWRANVEIALEDLHVPYVHPTTFHKLKLKCDKMENLGGGSSGAIYTITDARTVKALKAISKYFLHPQPDLYFHFFFYPNECFSSVGGFTFSLQRYAHIHTNTTLFSSTLYRGKTIRNAPALDAFFDSAAKFNAQVFAEDAQACERIIEYNGDGPLAPDERRVKWFREAMK